MYHYTFGGGGGGYSMVAISLKYGAQDSTPPCILVSTDLSLFHLGGAVQSEVDVAMVVEESLQHIQHLGHLGEDQNPRSLRLELP